MPHRVLRTEFVDRLERSGPATGLPRALRNAVAFQRLSGTPWREIVREGLAMKRSQELSWSQVVMAANTPMLLKAAMVDGRPDLGVMSSGQVVGVIDDLPSVAELVERIIGEADAVRSAAATAARGDTVGARRSSRRSMMVTLAWPPPSHMVWRP